MVHHRAIYRGAKRGITIPKKKRGNHVVTMVTFYRKTSVLGSSVKIEDKVHANMFKWHLQTGERNETLKGVDK